MPDARDETDGLTPLCGGNPLAGELARLVPAAPGFQRDALLFAAGAATRQASVTRWRWSTAAALFVAVGSWGYVVFEPADTGPVTRSSDGPPAPGAGHFPPPVSPAGATESGADQPLVVTFVDDADPGERVRALRLRNDILMAGLGVIPSTARPEATAHSTLAELERSLGLPAGTFAVPMVEKPKSGDRD